MAKGNDTLKYKVKELKSQVKQLEKKVAQTHDYVWKILTNELPHLEKQGVFIKGKLRTIETRNKLEFKNMNTKIKMGVTINIIQFVALVIGVVLLLRR